MYRHTQHVPVGVLAASGVAGGLVSMLTPKPVRAVAGLSVAAALFTFRSLTVAVDDHNITLQFGGWLRVKTIPIQDIDSCKRTETHAVIGWGIHFVGDGWLYRVAGRDAVRIKLKTGEKIFIASDETPELNTAIENAIAAYRSTVN